MIKCIFACDTRGGIGFNNFIPWKNRKDIQFFRDKTLNNIVIMGYNTLYSIKQPLKERINIVLEDSDRILRTKRPSISNNVLYLPEADILDIFNKKKQGLIKKDVYIIGGAKIIHKFFDYIDNIYITHIDNTYLCDSFIDLNLVYENFDAKEMIDSFKFDNTDCMIVEYTKKDKRMMLHKQKFYINSII